MVTGTMNVSQAKGTRPVSVMHAPHLQNVGLKPVAENIGFGRTLMLASGPTVPLQRNGGTDISP